MFLWILHGGTGESTGLPAELCVVRMFEGVSISLVNNIICSQSTTKFPGDRLGASIEFPCLPDRAHSSATRIVCTELCVLRTFGGIDFSLVFIRWQSVSEFLWDRLRASIQFPVMPKRAPHARFSGGLINKRRVVLKRLQSRDSCTAIRRARRPEAHTWRVTP